MPNVAIAYKSLPKYRVDFFDRLRSELATQGVDLSLVYGVNGPDQKQEHGELDWAIRSPVTIRSTSRSSVRNAGSISGGSNGSGPDSRTVPRLSGRVSANTTE